MSTSMFDLKEIVMSAWEGFKKNALILVVLPLGLAVILAIIYGFSMFFMMFLPFLIFLFPIVVLFETLLSLYVLLSMVRASLAIIKGETPSWEILKNDAMVYLKFVGAFIIIGIVVGIFSTIVSVVFPAILGANAFSFLVVAILLTGIAIAVSTFFFPVQFMIADKKDAGIIDSIKNSCNMTLPKAIPCLIFIIICFAANFVGSIPLGLGLFITIPVSLLAAAIVFKKLESAPIEIQAGTAPTETTDTTAK